MRLHRELHEELRAIRGEAPGLGRRSRGAGDVHLQEAHAQIDELEAEVRARALDLEAARREKHEAEEAQIALVVAHELELAELHLQREKRGQEVWMVAWGTERLGSVVQNGIEQHAQLNIVSQPICQLTIVARL